MGDFIETQAEQYASLKVTDPDAQWTIDLSPDGLMQYLAGKLNDKTDEYVTCENFATNCERAIAYRVYRTIAKGFIGLEYGPPHAWLEVKRGVVAAFQDVGTTISKSVIVLASDQGAAFPVPSASPLRTLAAATSPTIEVKVDASGTWFYVISGSAFIVNRVSQKVVKVSAGHSVFIPRSRAKAARMNMKRSVHAFDASSVELWWTSLVTAVSPPPPQSSSSLCSAGTLWNLTFLASGTETIQGTGEIVVRATDVWFLDLNFMAPSRVYTYSFWGSIDHATCLVNGGLEVTDAASEWGCPFTISLATSPATTTVTCRRKDGATIVGQLTIRKA